MNIMLSNYINFLQCPDDGSVVAISDAGYIGCTTCGRRFNLLKDNFLEILPTQFPSWGQQGNPHSMADVEARYNHIFNSEFAWIETPVGWGNFSVSNAGYRAFVKAEYLLILKLLAPSKRDIAVDVSGGVGNYSLSLANHVSTMFHCELDSESIQAAYRRNSRDNVVFIRTPYLKLPFRSEAVDCVICTDTLIRGRAHDLQLLNEIHRILKKGGKAVVDFHNRRAIVSNDHVHSYSESSLMSLLSDAQISDYKIYPFGHIPSMLVPSESLYCFLNSLSRCFIPRQRHIVSFVKQGNFQNLSQNGSPQE